MKDKTAVTQQAGKLVAGQLVISLLAALGFYYLYGQWMMAAAAAFGGLIAVFASLMLYKDVARAQWEAADDPKRSIRTLIAGAAQRFFMIVAAFGVGLVWLKLQPLALCAGFAVAQLCYTWLARTSQQADLSTRRAAGQDNN